MQGNSDKPDMIEATEEMLNEDVKEEIIDIEDEDDQQKMREAMMNINDKDIDNADVVVNEVTGVTSKEEEAGKNAELGRGKGTKKRTNIILMRTL